jgi:hypothetical protein
MPSVGFRPPASRPFFKKLLAVRALPTLNEPRCHVIGNMAGVAFVIKRELFDSPVPSVEFCKLVVKISRTATPRTRDSRHTTLRQIRSPVIGHTSISHPGSFCAVLRLTAVKRSGSEITLLSRLPGESYAIS